VSVSPLLAQVLVNRGIKDADSIKDFLYPSLNNIHDPFLIPDMEKAVDRLRAAIERKDKVLIHGDYDADGLTSTALLVSALNKLGLNVSYHIPNRISEGYGLSSKGIQKAASVGAQLIITADCGISSAAEVAKATLMGMDVIVTDHHEPPEKLPVAVAVINPHRKDSDYPFKYLAGVGVAFKLIQALIQYMGHGIRGGRGMIKSEIRNPKSEIILEDLLDLVALGTIADSVPLFGENRIFVAYGLKRINDSHCRVGVQAIREAAGVNGSSRAESLSYSLIPRINAAGRLDDAGQVVELFLTEDEGKAKGIAGLLEEQNRKRRKIESEVLESALDMINPNELESAIILSSPDWHPGVIGIVASRLLDMFYRPVFLFSVKDAVAKGSARGIPQFHLYEAIDTCSEFLLGYGGHRHAAGLKLDFDKLPAFKKRMNQIVDKELGKEDVIPVLEIDAAVKFSDLNFNLIKELTLLEPYGNSNNQPVFGAKDIEIVSHKIVGNNHLKMQLKQEAFSVDTIGFGMGDQLKNIETVSSLDIAFVPSINEWNGTRNLQLNLKAIRRPGR
jgi:single-stranded-DNA-specific exonuclease